MKLIIRLSFILFTLFINVSTCFAQQTIFNVPSADVTPKGRIFVQHESQFSNKFALQTEYGAFGIGKNTEIDVTLLGIGTNNVANEVLGIGFKSFINLHKKSETKLTYGTLLPISLRGKGVGGYAYSHLSTRIPKLNTRITSGVFVGTTSVLGRDFVSYIAGVEQPITKRFSLIMDYFSGKHANGFLIPGFSYYLGKNYTLYAGYQIHNNKANGDNGFVLELSKIF